MQYHTGGIRSFNIGALAVFFISIIFTMVFFGGMTSAQTWFYFYFIALAGYNTVYFALPPLTRTNWIKARLFTVYAPVALLLVFLVIAFIQFFSVLDDLNNVTNNAFPVPEKDLQINSSYIVLTFVLYILPTLVQGVSFCAYASELGMYLDDKRTEITLEDTQ